MNEQTFVATKNQISSGLSEETIILDLESGVYHSLDDVGSSVWRLLQQPKTIKEICHAVVDEYQVEPQQCERDINELLKNLVEAGLIEVNNAGAAQDSLAKA